MNSIKLLEANNVHKTYNHSNRAVQVLKGVDLKIDKGEFVAIVGHPAQANLHCYIY